MARAELHTVQNRLSRELLTIGIGVAGMFLLAKRLNRGPLIVGRAEDDGRLTFLPFEKFKEKIGPHVIDIRNGLNPAEANSDAQVVQISSRRRRAESGLVPDIDTGRVRHSSETNPTRAQVSAQTDTDKRDVVDIIDEALAESSSIFGPRGWKGFMGEGK